MELKVKKAGESFGACVAKYNRVGGDFEQKMSDSAQVSAGAGAAQGGLINGGRGGLGTMALLYVITKIALRLCVFYISTSSVDHVRMAVQVELSGDCRGLCTGSVDW